MNFLKLFWFFLTLDATIPNFSCLRYKTNDKRRDIAKKSRGRNNHILVIKEKHHEQTIPICG
ncbi:MAG TPA: hypothetical protein DCS93_24155 [Microscillaceae bacterium]|nr:hypothetical protein [Microscillaceae bacterium]